MKTVEIRKLTTPELYSRLDETREELFKLRFQYATGQLVDTSRLNVTRKTTARILTIIRERELEEYTEAEEG